MKAKPVRDNEGYLIGYRIYCEGCKENHILTTSPESKSKWTFNGDVDNPTFHPSLLIKVGPLIQGEEKEDWYENYSFTSPNKQHVCHSFITNGQMKFLGDCTHELRDKTVTLRNL